MRPKESKKNIVIHKSIYKVQKRGKSEDKYGRTKLGTQPESAQIAHRKFQNETMEIPNMLIRKNAKSIVTSTNSKIETMDETKLNGEKTAAKLIET